MVTFKGTGGQPPSKGNQSNSFKKALCLSEPVGAGSKKVNLFMVGLGAGGDDPSNPAVPVTTLDPGEFDTSVRLHTKFLANGATTNVAVCIREIDERGCPLCDTIGKLGAWYACGTVIDGSEFKFTIEKGARKDETVVITNQRKLLAIGFSELERFKQIYDEIGSWKWQQFKVKRGLIEKSPRIGTSWFTKGALTQEQMIEKYAATAAAHGLPVEKYIEPLPYADVLKPFSYEKLKQIASTIKPATATGAPAPAEEEEAIQFDV